MPGASPETMATSVATPLERHLGHIADVTEMTSTKHGRQHPHHPAIRPRPRHRRRRARCAGGASTPRAPICPPALKSNPTYRKVNPADAPIMILALTSPTLTPGQIYDAGLDRSRSKNFRRWTASARSRSAAARCPPCASNSTRTRLFKYGIGLEDVRAALAAANANAPKGAIEEDGHALPDLHQRSGAPCRRLPRPDHRLSQQRAGAPVRCRRCARIRSRICATRVCSTASPSVMLILFKQPGANIIETIDRVKALLPQLQGLDPRRHRPDGGDGPHDHHPRLAARCRAHAVHLHRPGDPGGVPVPAQRARDADPQRRRAGFADRHVRRHVSARLQPRQSVADGADHRDRLRGRRRDRGAGKCLAPYRRRHAAHEGGFAWARAKSALPCCR